MSASMYIARAIKICELASSPAPTTVESELALADAISTLLADTIHDSELQQSTFDFLRLRSTGMVPMVFDDREHARNLAETYTKPPQGDEVALPVLKSGDVVYLNSGSPPLCVVGINEFSSKHLIDVTWMDAVSSIHDATFDRRMLCVTEPKLGRKL